MSLVELKKAAQTRSIKMYYTKKRSELIQLLTMKELPASFVIEKFTILELRAEAKKRGMRGFWKLSRDDMVALLYPDGTLTTKKEDHNPEGHQSPQSEDTHDVGV